MGQAIIGGALTTATAGLLLTFCKIQIFSKFGTIIMVNIVMAMVFSMLFFGDLRVCIPTLWRTCTSWIKPPKTVTASKGYSKVGDASDEI
jgi:hypothetical protein